MMGLLREWVVEEVWCSDLTQGHHRGSGTGLSVMIALSFRREFIIISVIFRNPYMFLMPICHVVYNCSLGDVFVN